MTFGIRPSGNTPDQQAKARAAEEGAKQRRTEGRIAREADLNQEIAARSKLLPNEVSRYDRAGINLHREQIIKGEMRITAEHLNR